MGRLHAPQPRASGHLRTLRPNKGLKQLNSRSCAAHLARQLMEQRIRQAAGHAEDLQAQHDHSAGRRRSMTAAGRHLTRISVRWGR